MFSLLPITNLSQVNMWYVDLLETWVTSDQNCRISFWNIAEQTRDKYLDLPRAKKAKNLFVIDIKVIDHLKLLVIATSDKILSVHESGSLKCHLIFSLDLGGFNLMEYFESYQVLLLAGYENTIKVVSVNPDNFELNTLGRLVGHVGIIAAMKPVDSTAMVISADEKGFAKIWDIRKLSCIQTIQLSNKIGISCISFQRKQDRVVFLGERISCLEFEPDPNENHKFEKIYPIHCDINESTGDIFLVTKTEVRVVNILNGRVKSIYVNQISKETYDEITAFQFLHRSNEFMVGNLIGNMSVFNASNAELVKRANGFTGRVVQVKIDNVHDMQIVCSTDGVLRIQADKSLFQKEDEISYEEGNQETNEFYSQPALAEDLAGAEFKKFERDLNKKIKDMELESKNKNKPTVVSDPLDQIEVVRQISGCNDGYDFSIMEISIYHNLIALGGMSNRVYLYNFEYIRPSAAIVLANKSDVTFIAFINGYYKLLVGDKSGLVYLFSLKPDGSFYVKVSLDFFLDIKEYGYTNPERPKIKDKMAGYIDKGVNDILLVDSVEEAQQTKYQGEKSETSKMVGNLKSELKLQNSEFYMTESTGIICRFSFKKYLAGEKVHMAYYSHPNYNPFRRVQEDFSLTSVSLGQYTFEVDSTTEQKYTDGNQLELIRAFKVTREKITHIDLWRQQDKFIFLASQDSTFRILRINGEVLCHLNLNHPLPIVWRFNPEWIKNSRGNAALAIKTIEILNQRYNKPEHRRLLNTKRVIETFARGEFSTFSLTSIEQESRPKGTTKNHIPSLSKLGSGTAPRLSHKPSLVVEKDQMDSLQNLPSNTENKIILMEDIYTAKDLAYEKIRSLNREEIQGPTLKQMDSIRRAKNIMKMRDPIDEFEVDKKILEKGKDALKRKNKQNPISNFFGKFAVQNPLKDIIRKEQRESSMAGKLEIKIDQVNKEIEREREMRSEKSEELSSSRFSIGGLKKSKVSSRKSKQKTPILSSKEIRVKKIKSINRQETSSGPLKPVKEESVLTRKEQSQWSDQKKFLTGRTHSQTHLKSDLFEYASEKNLVTDDEYSRKLVERSNFLNKETSRTTRASNKDAVFRQLEKHKFMQMMKLLDSRITKAKTSTGGKSLKSTDVYSVAKTTHRDLEPPSVITFRDAKEISVPPSTILPKIHK